MVRLIKFGITNYMSNFKFRQTFQVRNKNVKIANVKNKFKIVLFTYTHSLGALQLPLVHSPQWAENFFSCFLNFLSFCN
jgi:hypothetical protein